MTSLRLIGFLISGKKNSLKGKIEHKVYLLTGSNLGDRSKSLKEAEKSIHENCGNILKSSSIYESEPWNMDSDDWFLNQVHLIGTTKTALELLEGILQIETILGRTRKSSGGYESRIIDIDILYIDSLVYDTPELIVPHPRIQERRFVLVPMVELNPDIIHPIFNKSQKELLNLCSDTTKVEWKSPK